VLVLAGFGLVRLRRAALPYAPLVPFGAAAVECLIFLEGVMRHDFWGACLAPGVLMLAGAGAVAAADLIPRPRIAAVFSSLLLMPPEYVAIKSPALSLRPTMERSSSIRSFRSFFPMS